MSEKSDMKDGGRRTGIGEGLASIKKDLEDIKSLEGLFKKDPKLFLEVENKIGKKLLELEAKISLLEKQVSEMEKLIYRKNIDTKDIKL